MLPPTLRHHTLHQLPLLPCRIPQTQQPPLLHRPLDPRAGLPLIATSSEAHPAPRAAIDAEAPLRTAASSPTAQEEEASSSTAAAKVLAAPPMELTVKHVGFLGSLAHALVHLQQPSQGLALLRAAASVMRTNPLHHPHWFQGFPDPRPLHAHVLMDLVLPSMALTFSHLLYHQLTVSEQGSMSMEVDPTHAYSFVTAAFSLLLCCGPC